MDKLIMLRLLCRSVKARNAVIKQNFHTSIRQLTANDSSSSSDSSDSSDSDNEKPKKETKRVILKQTRDENAKQQTVDLLNNLFTQMIGENLVTKTIDIAIPPRKPREKVKKPTLEEKLTVAAKEVAESLGGDVQNHENKLLDKIFSAGTPPQQKQVPPSKKAKKFKAQENKETKGKPVEQDASLGELLAGMKIDRSPRKSSEDDDFTFARSEKVRALAEKFQSKHISSDPKRFSARISQEIPGDLYAGKSFNIFHVKSEKMEPITTNLDTWNELEKKALKMMVVHPPQNYFEELIQWTEQGILWKFPIDNQQGMEAEESVHFSEHVFLEKYLSPWCPKKGPIRHFMDLVCIGLSKNPYITVEEKKEHILWYRDYFGDKQELLKEIGAIQNNILGENENKKQIEA